MVIALSTYPFHVCGDWTVPHLQLNDWENTLHKEYFWGQSFLATYEVRFFHWMARLFWSPSEFVPYWFSILGGQFLYSLGALLFYIAVRPTSWLVFLVLVGFPPPAYQKMSFCAGTAYSSFPLITGMGFFLISRLEKKEMLSWFLGGAVFGLGLSLHRITVVVPFALVLYHVIFHRKNLGWHLLGLGVGSFVGFLPELLHPPQVFAPAGVALFPLPLKFHNFVQLLSQMGHAFGISAQTLFEGEHALWFRGHSDLPKFWDYCVRTLSGAVFLFWLTKIAKHLQGNIRRFALFLIAVNAGVLILANTPADIYGSRRYFFPGCLAVSVLIYETYQAIPVSRAAVYLRSFVLILATLNGLYFSTPLQNVRPVLEEAKFDLEKDCVLGFGGDLSALIGLTGSPYRVIDTGWRLQGNYSRSVTLNQCRHVYRLETFAWSDEKQELVKLCKTPRLLFEGTTRSLVPIHQRIQLFQCDS